MKPRHPREAAMPVAAEIVKHIRPACEPDRLMVVGSMRRLKPDVGDIEFLFIPMVTKVVDPGSLFGEKVQASAVDVVLERLLASGVIAKRPGRDGREPWGPKNKFATHCATGIPLDFFTASRHNWWNLVVCRTGPAASNIRICEAARARGWKWDPQSPGFESEQSGKLVAGVYSEADVFTRVGLQCLPPKDR